MISQAINKEINKIEIAQGFMDINLDCSIDSLGHMDTLMLIELCEQKEITLTITKDEIDCDMLYIKESKLLILNLAGA